LIKILQQLDVLRCGSGTLVCGCLQVSEKYRRTAKTSPRPLSFIRMRTILGQHIAAAGFAAAIPSKRRESGAATKITPVFSMAKPVFSPPLPCIRAEGRS